MDPEDCHEQHHRNRRRGRGCSESGGAAAGTGAVRRQLCRLQHERRDQRDRQRPRHLGDRDPDHDHPVHADDGRADDSGQQADRHLGPQVLLPVGARHLRSGRPARLVRAGLPLLMIGYSLLEGVGSALLIHPIYILVTMLFDDTTTSAKYFGVVSAAAGMGSAAGPLIGGLVTSYISWRASFILQVLIVAAIIWLGRGIADPPLPAQRPAFDWLGAVLSALGLFFVVFGVLQSGVYGWGTATQDYVIGGTVIIRQGSISPVWLYVGLGVVILALFVGYAWARERNGRAPLVSVGLFANLTSNLGLLTQNLQWLVLQGAFFVISVFLQQVRGFSAIETGLVLVPATIGLLLSSAAAPRMARRHSQRRLIRFGFFVT